MVRNKKCLSFHFNITSHAKLAYFTDKQLSCARVIDEFMPCFFRLIASLHCGDDSTSRRVTQTFLPAKPQHEEASSKDGENDMSSKPWPRCNENSTSARPRAFAKTYKLSEPQPPKNRRERKQVLLRRTMAMSVISSSDQRLTTSVALPPGALTMRFSRHTCKLWYQSRSRRNTLFVLYGPYAHRPHGSLRRHDV